MMLSLPLLTMDAHEERYFSPVPPRSQAPVSPNYTFDTSTIGSVSPRRSSAIATPGSHPTSVKHLTKQLGINQNLSTAAHPQTDGLSERKNQWVEQYLRLVTSAEPDTWATWLPLATLVHNNRQNATTKLSPNQILLGYEPLTTHIAKTITDNQATEDRLGSMEAFRKQAVQTLNDVAKRGPTLEAQYKVNDKVWLEGTNLKLPHQATKLRPNDTAHSKSQQ
jgi:hypothetical protein